MNETPIEIIAKDLQVGMKIKLSHTTGPVECLSITEEVWMPTMDYGPKVITTTWADGMTRRYFMHNQVGILAEKE